MSFAEQRWFRVSGGLSGRPVFFSADGLVKKAVPAPSQPLIRQHRHWERLLAFVPPVLTWFEEDGQWWEISRRVEGVPQEQPGEAAAIALGELHRHSLIDEPTCQPLQARVEYVQAVSGAAFAPIPPGRHHAIHIHGDLHREHILYNGSRVAGMIDGASVKLDHPAVDFARHFEDDTQHLAAYHAAGGSTAVTAELVRYIDAVILQGALAYWREKLKTATLDDQANQRYLRLQARLQIQFGE